MKKLLLGLCALTGLASNAYAEAMNCETVSFMNSSSETLQTRIAYSSNIQINSGYDKDNPSFWQQIEPKKLFTAYLCLSNDKRSATLSVFGKSLGYKGILLEYPYNKNSIITNAIKVFLNCKNTYCGTFHSGRGPDQVSRYFENEAGSVEYVYPEHRNYLNVNFYDHYAIFGNQHFDYSQLANFADPQLPETTTIRIHNQANYNIVFDNFAKGSKWTNEHWDGQNGGVTIMPESSVMLSNIQDHLDTSTSFDTNWSSYRIRLKDSKYPKQLCDGNAYKNVIITLAHGYNKKYDDNDGTNWYDYQNMIGCSRLNGSEWDLNSCSSINTNTHSDHKVHTLDIWVKNDNSFVTQMDDEAPIPHAIVDKQSPLPIECANNRAVNSNLSKNTSVNKSTAPIAKSAWLPW
jgi:hypothetical protein